MAGTRQNTPGVPAALHSAYGPTLLDSTTSELEAAAHLRLVETDEDVEFCPRCWSEVEALEYHCDRCGALRGQGWVEDPLLGRTIGGYELTERIGEGGMALVYRAHDARLGADVAIKLLRPEHAKTLTSRRFLAEAQMASRLTSPHTVRVFGYGEDGDVVFMVMELLRGESLEHHIDAEKPASAAFVVELLRQIGEALHEAHASGIVHRDVKPQNVMVIELHSRPHFKLLDFGIARAFERKDDPRLTRTGFVVGTPRYMSPEQIMGRDLDGRSDLFSLGLIALELLSGRVSSDSTSGRELMMERVLEDLPAACELAADAGAPDWVYDLVDGLLRRDADERVPTAATMVAHLVRRQGEDPASSDRPAVGAALLETADRPGTPARSGLDRTAIVAPVAEGSLDLKLTRFVSEETDESEVQAAIEDLFAPRLRARLVRWLVVALVAAAGTLAVQETADLENAWQLFSEPRMTVTVSPETRISPVLTIVGHRPDAPVALPGGVLSQGSWDGLRVTVSHDRAGPVNLVRVAVEREDGGRYQRAGLDWADVRMTRGLAGIGPHIGLGALDGAPVADFRFTQLERATYDAHVEVVLDDGQRVTFSCGVCTNEYGASCGVTSCEPLPAMSAR